MSSVAVHAFEAIKHHLSPTADHMTVVADLASAIANHRETIPKPETPTTLETTDTNSSTSQEVRARDIPISGEGTGTAKARADIRMGSGKRRGL